MQNRMPNLWTLGGLSVPELLRRTILESWHDDVFGQGGRMAFYQPSSRHFAFAVLYRFALNLKDHAIRWSTPGALCALILWLASTFAAQIYFNRINDYTRSYGPLSGVVMLLLWLYASNGALLIGGEMNSEIQKSEAGRDHPDARADRHAARRP